MGLSGMHRGTPDSGKSDLNYSISTAELKYVGPRYIHMVIAFYVLEVESTSYTICSYSLSASWWFI